MRLRASVPDLIHMNEIRIVDLMRRQLVQRPCGCECRQDETIKSRIDARRHGLLDHLNAAAGVIRQMFGDERLAESLDPGLINHALAGVPLQLFERRQLGPWTPLPQNRPPTLKPAETNV